VPEPLVKPVNLLVEPGAQARVSDWQYAAGERGVKIKAAKDFNNALKAKYTRALAVIQGKFKGGCKAATLMVNAIVKEKSSKVNFYRVLKVLAKEFEPNSTVDALKFRSELANREDKDISYHEWDWKFGELLLKLEKLDAMPTMGEIDQMVIKNVKNSKLEHCVHDLMVDTVKFYHRDEDRIYSYKTFREVAMSLASQDTRIDDFMVSGGEKALYAGEKIKKDYVKFCWRCGGDHLVHGCVGKVCHKCGTKLVDALGKLVRHEARNCSQGGGTPDPVISKGGDRGGDKGNGGKKGKGAWGGAKQSSGGGARDSLPDPNTFKSKQLKVYMSKCASIVKERDAAQAVGSKRKKTDNDWDDGEKG
jgi:hypothetical protein